MGLFNPDLTTLDAVKENNGITTADSDDAMLTRFIHQASAWFQQRCDRTFVPYYDEWTQDANYARALDFDDEVLEMKSVVNGDDTVVTTSQYRLLPSNRDTKYRISLLGSTGLFWTYTDDPEDAIAFQGTLGTHDDYAHAFLNQTTLTGTLSVSDDAAVVASANGFEVLHYVRLPVGNELAQVAAVANGTLTLDRGVLGTTARAQVAGSAVQIYQGLSDVQSAVDHIVSWMYDNRDTSGRTIQFGDGGSKLMEGKLPAYAVDVLSERTRRVIVAEG